MALKDTNTNVQITHVLAFNSIGGTATGSRMSAYIPVRGRVKEVGFVPNSLVASAITLAVSISANDVNSAASNFSQIVTSTLGTFSSTNLFEGACASVIVPQPSYCNPGDTIQWTTSGGNSSAIGLNLYAIIQRG